MDVDDVPNPDIELVVHVCGVVVERPTLPDDGHLLLLVVNLVDLVVLAVLLLEGDDVLLVAVELVEVAVRERRFGRRVFLAVPSLVHEAAVRPAPAVDRVGGGEGRAAVPEHPHRGDEVGGPGVRAVGGGRPALRPAVSRAPVLPLQRHLLAVRHEPGRDPQDALRKPLLVLDVVEVGGHRVTDTLLALEVQHDVEYLEPCRLEVGEHGLHVLQLVLHVLLAVLPTKLRRLLK